MIVLDTQAMVWIAERDAKIGPESLKIEAESDQVYVSAITLWEIGLLVSRNKISLSLPVHRWIENAVKNDRTTIMPVTREIALDAGLLPDYDHGDPGDRIILATARACDCPVVTSDGRMLAYGTTGHVRVIDARR